jgi:hypothetical protein
MFFLLRVAFWLTIVLALLPTGTSQPNSQGPGVNATEAVVAAGAAVSDVSHFCERQAEACAVGSQTAIAIGQRAQAGAKMVYEFINDRMTRSETGSIPAAVPPSHPGSQSTLRPADVAPAWRGPAAPKDAAVGRGAVHLNVMMPRPDPRKAFHPPA